MKILSNRLLQLGHLWVIESNSATIGCAILYERFLFHPNETNPFILNHITNCWLIAMTESIHFYQH